MGDHVINALDDQPAARLFFAFLRGAAISESEAARALGVSQSVIYRWHRITLPSASVRARIERWTRGRVSTASWLRADERARLDAVVPVRAKLLGDVDRYLASEAERGAL